MAVQAQGTPTNGRALACQWLACGAAVVAFTAMLQAIAVVPAVLSVALILTAGVMVTLGAITWHRAAKQEITR